LSLGKKASPKVEGQNAERKKKKKKKEKTFILSNTFEEKESDPKKGELRTGPLNLPLSGAVKKRTGG